MHNSWKTLGHESVKTVLQKQLETESQAHAYLFKGPEGLGKKTLAIEFAQKLLGTSELLSHPDFVSLGAQDKVSVEEIRGLITKLSVKPFTAKYTVAIVDNAQLLNASSSNALLKLLEEPTPTSIIILVASGSVIGTIHSRCQTFVFNPLRFEDFKIIAQSLKLSPSEEMYSLSGGSPGKVFTLEQNPGLAAELQERVAELENLQGAGVPEKIIALKELADLESKELSDLLLAWLYKTKYSLPSDPAKFRLIRHIMTALRQLETNMNKKFVLQKLFLES